jgi:DNA-binding CsgD family transcriptional regulator
MSITNRKKRAASSQATPISSQETSAGEDIPLTSVDGDELQLDLSALHQQLHGQSTDVVERLCQEIMDASQAQVQLVLQKYQYQPSQMLSFPEHGKLSLPVIHAGRTYGRLEIGPDPTRPGQPVLTYHKMQLLAIHCAFILYSLETAAYFQREYPLPVKLPVSLTPREQEVLGLMCRGHQRKHIASMLHIKPATVGKICEKMYPRLGVSTEREAIAAAFRLGLSFPVEHLTATIDLPSVKQEA